MRCGKKYSRFLETVSTKKLLGIERGHQAVFVQIVHIIFKQESY